MANSAAKKRKQSNEQFLLYILIGIVVVNVLYGVLNIRSIFIVETFTTLDWALWIFGFLLVTICYVILRMSARCTYDGQTLVSAGEDLKAGGLLGNVFDILCVVCIVQLLTTVSRWVWCLLIIIPIYAAIKLWSSVLSPLFFGQKGGVPAEMDEKSRKKMERKQNRVKYR